MPSLPVPWCDAPCHPSSSEHDRMATRVGEHLYSHHPKPLQQPIMAEEHCHGEHTHPQ
jgi:hypothetical protein